MTLFKRSSVWEYEPLGPIELEYLLVSLYLKLTLINPAGPTPKHAWSLGSGPLLVGLILLGQLGDDVNLAALATKHPTPAGENRARPFLLRPHAQDGRGSLFLGGDGAIDRSHRGAGGATGRGRSGRVGS